MNSVDRNNVRALENPNYENILKSKWCFGIKSDPNRNITLFKAIIVSKAGLFKLLGFAALLRAFRPVKVP